MVVAGKGEAVYELKAAVRQRKSNYAINPTPEQALRSNRALLPARVIAALGVFSLKEVGNMRLHGSIKFMLLSLCFVGMAQGQSLESDMLKLEGRWNSAHLKGDIATLKDLWADELSIVVPSMEPMSKSEALRFWEKVPIKFSVYESEIISTRPLGAGAIVIGRVHRVREFLDKRSEDNWTFTKVYSRHGGEWQVFAYHASTSPES